jgi:uncharacterized protein (DUF488 family)
MRLFTIGHSNLSIEDFVALLNMHGVTAVADVRSSPYSRYSPQFNREPLKLALSAIGIHYVFLGEELGARRSEESCYVADVARYERIAKTDAFQNGLQRLREGAAKHSIALMCAEKDPLTCHRTILICRSLRDQAKITHILESGEIESQAQAESRLLKLLGLPERDLFRTREELLEDAYARQGEEIAYRRGAIALEAGAIE